MCKFRKDVIKANTQALNEYDQLQKEAFFTLVSLPMSLPETFSFILLSVRSLKRHAIDLSYDKKLIANNTLFHTETQVSQTNNLSAMQSILEEYTLDHNVSSFIYTSLTICYKSTILG